MATTQKKTNSARKTGGATGRSGSASGRKPSGGARAGGRQKAPASKPFRREVGALICLLLAIFSALGYFQGDALFLRFFCGTVKGLIGYGYWLLPPLLLAASGILAFHRGRPVRLRVWCALLTPVLAGGFLHLVLAKGEYAWTSALAGELWQSGRALASGGVLSGFLSLGLSAVFSRIGAGIIFVLVAVGMLMAACNVTVVDVVDWLKSRPHPEYEEEELPAPAPRPVSPAAPPREKRRPAIDIPVDDGPLAQEKAAAPPEPKRSFFDRRAKVPAPDRVLGGAEPEPPAAPAGEEASPAPAAAPPDPFPLPKEEAVSPAAAAILSPGGGSAAPLPEIVREPAVPKVKRGETEAAAAQVSQAVEQALSQTAPVYQYPPVSLLTAGEEGDSAGVAGELRSNQARLTDTIHSFGIDANIVNVTRGPSVTRYELELDQGVRLNKLTNLSDDIALALGASGVRIAPIPNKISMVGIEVPNKLVTPVCIHDVIDSREFRGHASKVAFAVGKDIGGNCIVGNIAKLPHMLIAGTTGSGKSVCTNSLIVSLLYKATPEEVRLIMVDPKMVELGIYNGIPHLLIPVVTDPKKAAGALQWAVTEMMKRYRMFSEVGVRDLASYNAHAVRSGELAKLPQVVVVIDELADLMLVAAKEVEESICRVAQMGRAAGMHLVIATQRPSADVITGLMKANIPSRIAFAVASSLESRIILDQTGAEKLVGRGDMLYFPLGSGKPTRVQGCLISDEEVARVVEFVKQEGTAQYDEAVLHEIEQNVAGNEKGSKGVGGASPESVDDSYDELLPSAIEVVVETGMASVSMLQRRLKLGYSRAARMVDQMEEKGIVGPFEGSKPRQVLISKEQWQEMQYKQGMVDLAPDAVPDFEPVPEELDGEGDAVPQPRDLPPFDLDGEDF